VKCLITGGAGFIGSHLCKILLKHGKEVICLDNLSTGNVENIEPFKHKNNFTFIENNVCDPFEFDVERIYNLACPASPVHYQIDPVGTLNTTLFGISNCLKYARSRGARVLQASTSEVYGDPLEHPQIESYWGNVNQIGARACYTEAKRCAETILINYRNQYNTSIRIARIFNTYGPNMQINDGRVISNFIIQALQNDDLTVFGKGEQTRSFCYCDDLVNALFLLMEYEHEIGPMNLGNTHEISILSLAETILRITGSRSHITFVSLPDEDPRRRKPNIEYAKTILKWEPTIGLEEGLLRTIEYFEHKLQRKKTE
jgi:UDP-glucuronate decarboxylase